ncbi:hypothetical protein G6672_09180 [Polynucleobacter paneuropaeus]|nr:hypothetical protein [Polynucleobacter paneuropaeus]
MLQVFGDSHSLIFGGGLVSSSEADKTKTDRYQNIKVHWLLGALAHNLIDEEGNLLKWGQEIVNRLQNESHTSAILLAFGEIDIRVHVIKIALETDRHPIEVCQAVAMRLLKFANFLIKHYKKPVFILSPVPSAPNFSPFFNVDIPNIGGEKERNYLSYQFGKKLEVGRKTKNGPFIINLFEDLTDSLLNTDTSYYNDTVHLNLKGLGLFVEKFNQLILQKKLDLKNYYGLDQLKYLDTFLEKDITGNCRLYKMSSSFVGYDSLVHKIGDSDVVFHTDVEANPYIIIDIGYISPLVKIILGNRKDWEDRCENLVVSISKGPDEGAFQTIYETSEIFGKDGRDLEIATSDYIGSIRFIKLQIMSQNYFHLSRVQLIEKSFLCD